MKLITEDDRKEWLTDLEIERYHECVKDFGTEGYLYYVTENCLGCGYEIWFSTKPLKSHDFDKDTTRNITDIEMMIFNM